MSTLFPLFLGESLRTCQRSFVHFCQLVRLSIRSPFRSSVRLSVHSSVRPSIHPSVCPSIPSFVSISTSSVHVDSPRSGLASGHLPADNINLSTSVSLCPSLRSPASLYVHLSVHRRLSMSTSSFISVSLCSPLCSPASLVCTSLFDIKHQTHSFVHQ